VLLLARGIAVTLPLFTLVTGHTRHRTYSDHLEPPDTLCPFPLALVVWHLGPLLDLAKNRDD
jgi:hypothetical protein